MDLTGIATLVALIGSIVSMSAVVFAGGRFVEAVDGLRSTVADLKTLVGEVIRDLREIDTATRVMDERVGANTRRIEDLEEDMNERVRL